MKRSHWFLALLSALVTLMVAPVAAADSPGRVDICHKAGGASEWRLLSVSARSVEQHVEHGDGMPSGEVPGSDGELNFDESCSVEASDPGDPGDPGDPADTETVFAIAYSDLDGDGAFSSEQDILIAKLVDGPGLADDGLPGSGDLVVTARYPMDLGAAAFGVFGVTEHTVTASTGTSTRCMASSASGESFIWDHSAAVDNYEERSASGALSFFRDSKEPGGSDVIVAAIVSPSQPGTAVSTFAFDGSDNPVVEVELNCSA